MQIARGVLRALAVLLGPLGCGSGEQADAAGAAPVLSFATASVRLVSKADTIRVLAELAERTDQHTLGLMERRQLADTAGMLFLYPSDQPSTAGFWMFRTLIPLDIAFVDSLGIIRSIQHMVPCTATIMQGCSSYPPGVPYRAALEVNAGYFARHTLGLGDRIILADTARRIR